MAGPHLGKVCKCCWCEFGWSLLGVDILHWKSRLHSFALYEKTDKRLQMQLQEQYLPLKCLAVWFETQPDLFSLWASVDECWYTCVPKTGLCLNCYFNAWQTLGWLVAQLAEQAPHIQRLCLRPQVWIHLWPLLLSVLLSKALACS